MRDSKFIFSVAVAAILGIGAASAADLPARPYTKAAAMVVDPAYNWTGFYVGGNAGYAWGRSDTTASADCPAGVPPGWFCALTIPGSLANVTAFNAAGSGRLNPNGFTGGVQAGYNWQTGKTVLGVEADFGALTLKSSRSVAFILPFGGFPGGAVVGSSVGTDWLFTARGRLGWAASDTLLIYATGGLALTNLKIANSYADFFPGGPGTEAASRTTLKAGWTAGAGLEWALNRNWSVKAEYLYVNFGATSVTGNITTTFSPAMVQALTTSSNLSAQIARVGVNYRFGGPVVTKY